MQSFYSTSAAAQTRNASTKALQAPLSTLACGDPRHFGITSEKLPPIRSAVIKATLSSGLRYNFRHQINLKTRTLEEAEEHMKRREQSSTTYQQWMVRTANSGTGAFPAQNGGATGRGTVPREEGGALSDDDGQEDARRTRPARREEDGDEEAGRVRHSLGLHFTNSALKQAGCALRDESVLRLNLLLLESIISLHCRWIDGIHS